jgi:hypothetical protein
VEKLDDVQALEEVMPQEQYLSALMSLLGSPEEAIVTRALRLFQTSLATHATEKPTPAAVQFCDQVSSRSLSALGVYQFGDAYTRRPAIGPFQFVVCSCPHDLPLISGLQWSSLAFEFLSVTALLLSKKLGVHEG